MLTNAKTLAFSGSGDPGMGTQTPSVEHGESLLDGERPRDAASARLWDMANRGRALAATRAAQTATLIENDSGVESDSSTAVITRPLNAESTPLTVQRSLPLEARLRSAARDIDAFDRDGVFASYPMSVSNEFPTLLTRLPIFRPSQRRKQQSIQDLDNAVPFDTPWGRGRRVGPPLTIRDEDTLIALMRLRDRVLCGPASELPATVRDFYARKQSGQTEVHRVVCTVNQINEELGLTDSGTNFKNTFESVKRLNLAKIELEQDTEGGKSRVGGAFDLIELRWLVYERHGLLDVIFKPMMAHWLKSAYTYVDWKTRMQLTNLGKAIHRFLSGQRHHYSIELDKLARTVGYDGRREHMKKHMLAACQELVALGWLEEASVRGTGRKTPWILTVIRRRSDLL